MAGYGPARPRPGLAYVLINFHSALVPGAVELLQQQLQEISWRAERDHNVKEQSFDAYRPEENTKGIHIIPSPP